MISEIKVFDSVTALPDQADHLVAYCASHGGMYSGSLALSARLRGVVLCDAGVGLDQAGIASLGLLDAAGVPAATVSHRSARIGDGTDGYARGRISYVNSFAAAQGVGVGDSCRLALERLARQLPAPAPRTQTLRYANESRSTAHMPDGTEVVLVDSNSLITQEDAGRIVVCGSHGGLLGGDAQSAVRVDVFGIVFNDADGGADLAGHSRLPALEARGIAGACVSAWTARIGDAQSSYETGVISALNDTARKHGAVLGMSTQAFVACLSATRRGGGAEDVSPHIGTMPLGAP